MVKFNKAADGETFEGRKEIGPDCKIQFTGGATGDGNKTLPVSSASFSEEAETSEVQYNDGFGRNLAVTGVTYSGSFEIPGNANDQRDLSWDNGSSGTTLPERVDTLSIIDGENVTYSFSNVMITSHEKDIPGDDRTSQSFDFEAETLTIA